jgi:phosphatidylglycerol---prolipoprotein diacylglyceryl transferase
MSILNFIIWSVNPQIFPDVSWLPPRWYGLLFAIAFIVGQQIYYYLYKVEGKSEKDVETLTIFIVVGTIIGARLGHVFFYEPDRFLSHPMEILMIWKGGLASHGAAIGIIVSVLLYCNYLVKINFNEFTFKRRKREGQGFLYVMDRIVIVVALGGFFVRSGNFMNSEIIGIPTHTNYGVLFARDVIDQLEFRQENVEKVFITRGDQPAASDSASFPVNIHMVFKKANMSEDYIKAYLTNQVKRELSGYEMIRMHINEPENRPLDFALSRNKNGAYEAVIHTYGIPRHPAQLYEAASCLVLFFALFFVWKERWKIIADGKIFGTFLIVVFTLRFLYEFLKENQVPFENNIPLNMGQWLSIPLVLLGIILMFRKGRSTNHIPENQ